MDPGSLLSKHTFETGTDPVDPGGTPGRKEFGSVPGLHAPGIEWDEGSAFSSEMSGFRFMKRRGGSGAGSPVVPRTWYELHCIRRNLRSVLLHKHMHEDPADHGTSQGGPVNTHVWIHSTQSGWCVESHWVGQGTVEVNGNRTDRSCQDMWRGGYLIQISAFGGR